MSDRRVILDKERKRDCSCWPQLLRFDKPNRQWLTTSCERGCVHD